MSIWTEERRSKARDAAKQWEGTPHQNRMAKPGVGIDCLGLLRVVAVAAGILPEFEMPFYDPRWGYGREFNIIERVLEECCHARRLEAHEPVEFGDVVVWTVGRQSNHVGIMIDDAIWHVQAKRFVQGDEFTTALQSGIQAVMRITADGFIRRPESLTAEDLRA
jgi:cell wall-associated NlpC family hydrolase